MSETPSEASGTILRAEALSLAILAVNTKTNPDATSAEDWDYLLSHADDVVATLADIREYRR